MDFFIRCSHENKDKVLYLRGLTDPSDLFFATGAFDILVYAQRGCDVPEVYRYGDFVMFRSVKKSFCWFYALCKVSLWR